MNAQHMKVDDTRAAAILAWRHMMATELGDPSYLTEDEDVVTSLMSNDFAPQFGQPDYWAHIYRECRMWLPTEVALALPALDVDDSPEEKLLAGVRTRLGVVAKSGGRAHATCSAMLAVLEVGTGEWRRLPQSRVLNGMYQILPQSRYRIEILTTGPRFPRPNDAVTVILRTRRNTLALLVDHTIHGKVRVTELPVDVGCVECSADLGPEESFRGFCDACWAEGHR